MLETFTQSTFSACLGETFRVHDASPTPLAMQLTDVTSLDSKAADETTSGQRASFSILFRGPADALLEQRIYTMSHDAIGTFELFLVPLGPVENGMRYEAVFT